MHSRRAGPTHWRVIRLALITDRGSRCDACRSQHPAAAAGMRKGADCRKVRPRQPGTSVMYRRWPAGLNPASSFIVHLLSCNESSGTRTVTMQIVNIAYRHRLQLYIFTAFAVIFY